MDIEPLYRLTVYAPSSEDPTERAVLTPIAGAAHADPFRVATTKAMMTPATNILLRSQEFDHASWSKLSGGGATAPVVTANAAPAPDGTLTADQIVFVAPAIGDQSVISQDSTAATVIGASYAGSLWLKAANGGDVGKTLLLRHVGRAAYTPVVLTADWQRVQATAVAALADNYFELGLRPDQGGSLGTVTALVWGAQLQQGALSDYIPTVAVPVTRPEYQPYLDVGKGRQGSINYTTKRTSTGNQMVSLLDARLTPGGSNAVRWATSFLGNAIGETRYKGCKYQLERSLDGGNLFVPFTAGRVRNNGVTRATRFDLELKDFADDLNRPLFKGAPHSSIAYAALGPLLPNGVVKPFGNLPLTPPLAATIGAPFSTAPDTVVVNVTTPSDPAAMITQAVLDSNSSTALRLVELTKVADGTKHYYQWPRGDSALASTNIPGGPTPHFGLTAFPIAQLPVGDPRREALPAVGTAVTVSIVQDAPPSEATPLLVNDVHPVQYIADILDGKFSLGPGETTLRPLAVRNTDPGNSWDTLLADPSFDTIREVITKLEPKANDYLEKVLLQRYNLVLDRDGRGRVDLVDLRRKPTLAGVVTLTDDDLVTATDPSWDDSRDGAITAVAIDYYVDQRIPPTDLVASSDTFPTLPSALIRSAKSTVLVLNDLSTLKDVGEKVITIAARGDRISSGDLLSAHFGRQRRDRLEGKLKAAALDFLRPIGSGVITAQATYRMASGNAQQIAKGKYCIVQHSKLPDPASNQRGGARLMLCLSCDERDGTLAVQWMDAGTGAVAVAPDITAVASANPYSIDVTVAANGDGDPIEIHVAVTETAVAVRPADTAGEWVFAVQTAAGTVRIANLPSGKRVWTRARSYGSAANMKLPSAWDYAPAPGYLDLAAGDPIDLSQPDPSWEPIATTGDIISPPSCYAFENPVRSNRATANVFLRGAVGDGSTTPLSWRYTVGNGAPSAWSTAPITGVSINVTRDKFYPIDVLLEVTQPDGQSASFTYTVGPNPIALDPGTGKVDPAQPLAGTSHFIPRATDVNGMILDPGVKDSRTAPLNGMFRYGTDTAAGVMETAGLGFLDPAHATGRIPNVLWSVADGFSLSGSQTVDSYRRAVNAIDGTQDGKLLAGAKDSRSAPLNGMGRTGVDNIAAWLDGGGYAKTTTNEKGGAGRAFAALNAGSRLVTGVEPDATVADQKAGALARRAGACFVETFDADPASTSWIATDVVAVASASNNSTMGGKLAYWNGGYGTLKARTPFPFNPQKLYRVRVRVLTNAANTAGASLWYLGFVQVDYAGAPIVNTNGGVAYVCASGASPTVGVFTEYVGWFKGATVPLTSYPSVPSSDPAAPAALNVGCVSLLPLIYAGYNGTGGQFFADYFLVDEFDEDGSMRTYSTIEQGGSNPLLKSNVKQYDGITSRVIAKGHSTGTARFPGSRILFPENYQNPPLVLLRGGLLSEPRAKWGPLGNGSETGAFNAALPVYEDLVALNLDASGFDLRARLRQKSGSTARSDNFPAGNSLSGLGATTQATLANAPANNDTYTANYTVSGTLTPFPGGSASLDVIVALDTSNDSGGTWQTRATKAYSIRAFGSPRTISWNTETMVAVAQLQAPGARVRLRIDTVDWTDDSGGSMSLAVHGRSGGGDGSGVTYNTSVDNFASKTPDAEDLITWEAIEVS